VGAFFNYKMGQNLSNLNDIEMAGNYKNKLSSYFNYILTGLQKRSFICDQKLKKSQIS